MASFPVLLPVEGVVLVATFCSYGYLSRELPFLVASLLFLSWELYFQVTRLPVLVPVQGIFLPSGQFASLVTCQGLSLS